MTTTSRSNEPNDKDCIRFVKEPDKLLHFKAGLSYETIEGMLIKYPALQKWKWFSIILKREYSHYCGMLKRKGLVDS